MALIPKDPAMCLSFINTQLRDYYSSLEELCLALDIDQEQLEEKLRTVDYEYDEKSNQFR